MYVIPTMEHDEGHVMLLGIFSGKDVAMNDVKHKDISRDHIGRKI